MSEAFEIRPSGERPGPGVQPKAGGAPDPLGRLVWPPCRSCGQPMAFLWQVPEIASALSLAPFAGAYVFQCQNPATACYRWRPDSGANAAIAVRAGEPVVEGAPAPGGAASERWMDLVADSGQRFSALGGAPRWRQDDATPECCARPMDFVMQLASEDFDLDFGDDGVGYLFRCAAAGLQHPMKFLSQTA